MSGRMYSNNPDEIRNKFNTIPTSHYLGLFGRNAYYSGLNTQKGYGLLSDFVRNYVLPAVVAKAAPLAISTGISSVRKRKKKSSDMNLKGGKIKKRKRKMKSKKLSKKKSGKRRKKTKKRKKNKKKKSRKNFKRALPFPLMS